MLMLKPAKKSIFKLIVISPIQWITWTQNYFFFNKVTKRDILAKGKKIRFLAYPRCKNLTTDVTKRSASVSGKSMDH